MEQRKITSKVRIYHRYLGFFLSGIMMIYAFSGIIMIFRTTDFLKIEKQIKKELQPNISKDDLGRMLFIRDFKVVEETDKLIEFEQGTYNKESGIATYKTKELPGVLQKMEGMHKATVNSPLFFLNIFFGLSLFFFAISTFWMFVRRSKAFKKGLYFALAGVILAILMVFI